MTSSSGDTLAPELAVASDLSTSLPSTTATEDFAQSAGSQPLRLPNLRTVNDTPPAVNMTASSTPLGALNAARRPGPPQSSLSTVRGGGLSQDMQAKMKAFHLSRQGAPPLQNLRIGGTTPGLNNQPHSAGLISSGAVGGGLALPGSNIPGTVGGSLAGGPPAFRLPPSVRPQPIAHNSAPAVPIARIPPKMGGLAAKRGLNRGMKLADASGPAPSSPTNGGPGNGARTAMDNEGGDKGKPGQPESMFSKYSEYVDTATGTLKFKGKATIHGGGIEFSSGTSFNISLDEVDTLEELGKGNYGTVYQVRHSRPQIRRPGLGLKGNKGPPSLAASSSSVSSSLMPPSPDSPEIMQRSKSYSAPISKTQGSTTGMIMAMKEIRLELDEAKFAAIIMELDILHRCISPFIIDFYGAFFQEGAVYICMEFMDGGSIDKLYGDGMSENVLRKVALSTVMGLKALKDEHNIIHRDVKPTNILVNSKGQVKICDFGVSGNLVASIAKTNIGCQSYMAPERISSGGIAQAGANPGGGTYSVQSDIWSLGLSVIECAMGRYPYPPETYNNIFSQLSVSTLWPDFSRQHFTNMWSYARLSSMAIPQTCQNLASPTQPAVSSGDAYTRYPKCALLMLCLSAIPGLHRCSNHPPLQRKMKMLRTRMGTPLWQLH